MENKHFKRKSAGYTYIIEKLSIEAIPNWHESYVSQSSVHKKQIENDSIEETYPLRYWPGDKVTDHFEFALKYDGVNLSTLYLIFKSIKKEEVIEYILEKPTGKYVRKIWFFYEFLMKEPLPIPNLTKGNYIELLEEDKYFTLSKGLNSQRHRIINNLLGDVRFCPIVRKTDELKKIKIEDLKEKSQNIIQKYPKSLIKRALNFLYKKETKSSFEIEQVELSSSRIEKFISVLELAEKEDFIKKEKLIELQNKIVDQRFKALDYRDFQNYVGQSLGYLKEIIHFICPKFEDLESLMDGLINSHLMMKNEKELSLIHVGIISYGLVFLHPFEDGNGRIHRFLIHNILALEEVVPKGLMFPISAVMLEEMSEYDKSLEAFSKPLLSLIDYELDQNGQMSISNETSHWYQFMDMTKQVYSLYLFILKTIETELTKELGFLHHYDEIKKNIQNIIDMPDKKIDLFISLCIQNNMKISEKKRTSLFSFLSNDEVEALEKIIKIEWLKED